MAKGSKRDTADLPLGLAEFYRHPWGQHGRRHGTSA